MAVVKRSISIAGHRTSYSLEPEFFAALNTLAKKQNMSLAGLVTKIDHDRPRDSNLSSALRIYVLEAAKTGQLAEDNI